MNEAPREEAIKANAERKKAAAKKAPQQPKGGDKGDAKGDAHEGEWHSSATGGETGKGKRMPILTSDKYATVELPTLRLFDPNNLKPDGTVIAVGKRRTGKSWLFRDLMWHMRDTIPAGIVISQTDELNKFWRQYIPAKYIFKHYDPAILDAVFLRQKAILNDPRLSEEERDAKAPFFILLDDVISDHNIRYDPNITELFVAGRHYRLFVLITTQYAKAITPTLRSNADYTFMFVNRQENQRESLWRDFADFLTKEAFFSILDAHTEDNECLVVDTSDPTSRPEDLLLWYKASDPGEFQMGDEEYWESARTDKLPPPNPQLMQPALLMPWE